MNLRPAGGPESLRSPSRRALSRCDRYGVGTPFRATGRSVRRLGAAGANVLGVILTKYRALEAGQAYGYQYDYYQYGGDKKAR